MRQTQDFDTLDVFKNALISGPSGQILHGNKFTVLVKSTNKFSRLSMTFETLVEVEKSSKFVFDIRYEPGSPVVFDILKGDLGLPEIHIESQTGEIFSFMRGNMKDFLSIRKINETQTVKLPIGSFVYNTFIKSNAPKSDDFFGNPIKKIMFDFLHSPLGDVTVVVDKIYIRQEADDLPAAIPLLSFWAADKYQDAPIFTTERKAIKAELVGKDFFNHIYPSERNPRLRLSAPNGDFSVETPIKESPTSIEIPMDAYGEIRLDAEIFIDDGKKIAGNTLTATRMCQATPHSRSKMGISDGANFYGAKLLGGEFLRLILPLSTVSRQGQGFQFNLGYDITPITSTFARKWIVSFKHMMSFLFKPEPYPYRLGPANFERYRKMLEWLIPKLLDAGVYGFEGWNEANIIHEWCDTMETLCEMQRCLYEVVREHSDTAVVLSPSSTSWDFDHFENLERNGILEYSDGLAFHAYSYSPSKVGEQFDRLEEFLERSSLKSKCAYLTEVGFRSPAFSNFEQASYFALFTIEAFFRERIRSMIWFRYQNPLPESFGAYRQNGSTGYAMVGHGGLYSRSALAVFRFLDMILSSTTPLRTETDRDRKSFFGIHDLDKIIVEYSERQEFSCLYEGYIAYDVFGNRVTPDTLGENIILIYFEKPVLL